MAGAGRRRVRLRGRADRAEPDPGPCRLPGQAAPSAPGAHRGARRRLGGRAGGAGRGRAAAGAHPGVRHQRGRDLSPRSRGRWLARASGPALRLGPRGRGQAAPAPGFAQLPGLGAAFRARIPAGTGQVLVASGKSATANTVTVVLYTRTPQGTWLPGAAWSGHNALDGWTTDHHEGDLHSPIGVYSLTDAGGLYANPGTKLPYLRSPQFQDLGTGFEGESLADAFNYVIAINYNHVPGTSPLSSDRPMGEEKGGGIWVHVDHGGPTHGCISLPQPDMVTLLRELDPARHPVIVMGDAAALAG
ncbi:L,D-transpeptidase family protein [Streptacidiphilus sp. 4-A2]|nr:L,D-transpeptidase family protein [Streptacidiphilus sp. 4-A2]